MYLFDTNVCIRLLNNSSPALTERFRNCNSNDIALCSVVKAELLYGAYHSRAVANNLRTLERFFVPLRALPFDDHCVHHLGQIRHVLASSGSLIGPYDLMIAATALAYDCTLVTANTREFARVPGLAIENWALH